MPSRRQRDLSLRKPLDLVPDDIDTPDSQLSCEMRNTAQLTSRLKR